MYAYHLTGAGLVLLGIVTAIAALLGPLALDVIDHKVSDDMLNQVTGADAVSLFVVAPVTIAIGWLALRGHPAAPVLAVGPAAYAAYVSGQLAIGQEFDRYTGNVEAFFPLYLGIFVLSGAVGMRAWSLTARDRLPVLTQRTARIGGIAMILVAVFLVVGLHLPGLADAWSAEPTSDEYLENPTVFWVVKLMDLGIVVPVAVATGAGLLRGALWAQQAGYAVIAWFALLGAAVTAMAVTMLVNDDPAASAGLAVGFGVFTIVFALLWTWLARPLFGSTFVRSASVRG